METNKSWTSRDLYYKRREARIEIVKKYLVDHGFGEDVTSDEYTC